jgi:hypothetical protein
MRLPLRRTEWYSTCRFLMRNRGAMRAQVFRCPDSFRVFAAQNPVREGGGRKGLPRSFLNRFTRVAVEPMGISDLEAVRCAWRSTPARVKRMRLLRSLCPLCGRPGQTAGATAQLPLERACGQPAHAGTTHGPFATGTQLFACCPPSS